MEFEENTSESFYAVNDSSQFEELSSCFVPFKKIQRIKERCVAKMKKVGLDDSQFVDFSLGTMTKLDSLSKSLSVEEFLREAYIGCSHVLLCLQNDRELTKISRDILPYISNALNVIEHVLTERGSTLPNLKTVEKNYRRNKLDLLPNLTKIYLRTRPDYAVLVSHQNLIQDFKVLSEISEGFRNLRDEFEELKRKTKPEIAVAYFNDDDLTMPSEMEETIELSGYI